MDRYNQSRQIGFKPIKKIARSQIKKSELIEPIQWLNTKMGTLNGLIEPTSLPLPFTLSPLFPSPSCGYLYIIIYTKEFIYVSIYKLKTIELPTPSHSSMD